MVRIFSLSLLFLFLQLLLLGIYLLAPQFFSLPSGPPPLFFLTVQLLHLFFLPRSPLIWLLLLLLFSRWVLLWLRLLRYPPLLSCLPSPWVWLRWWLLLFLLQLSLLPTSSSAFLFRGALAGPSGVSLLLLQCPLLLLVFLSFLCLGLLLPSLSTPGPSLLLLRLVLRSRWILPLLPVLPFLLCLILLMLRSVTCLSTLFAVFFVASPASSHLPIFLAWPGFLVCALLFLMLSIALSLCWLLVVLPPLPFLIVCLNARVHGDFSSSTAVRVFLPSFHVCALAIVFLGCACGVTFWLCLLVLLLDHRLWWLALAAGCPCVLVRVLQLQRSWVLLLSSCSAQGRCLLHLFLGFLLCPFLRLLQVSAACPAPGSLWRLLYLSSSSCLPCSCGGAMSVGFEVYFVRRLVLPCAALLLPAQAVCAASPDAGYPWEFLPFLATSACPTAVLVA